MKKVDAAIKHGRFFVTGQSDAANMPSHFYCRVCRKNVSVLTHGHHEVSWHFQGSRHFARDQRLHLETPGWRVLDLHRNPFSEDELQRQREKFRKDPLVVRDREHPFAEDLITDEAGVVDPQLPILTKVFCFMDPLKMGGSYGLIGKLWARFVLTAGPVNTEVAWTRDEVLVGSVDFRNHFVSFLIHNVVLLLVNHRYCNAAPTSVPRGWLGEGSPFLQPWIWGAWCVTVGLHADMVEGHFPSGCCGRHRPFCRRYYTQVISVWVSCGCCWWLSVRRCCFWRVACVGGHLRRASGKWVQPQAAGTPSLWSASPEAMPADGVLFRLWILGSVL